MQETINVRRKVLEAVLCLSRNCSIACATAILIAPRVVETESDPSQFLLLHERNALQHAAFKLASYWSGRFAIFGHRAFLPMNKTGMGALAPHDIHALNESFLQSLPSDDQCRDVFLVDDSTMSSFECASGIRCLFYQLHHVRKGAVFLLSVQNHTSFARLETFIKILSDLIHLAMPVALHESRIHFLSQQLGALLPVAAGLVQQHRLNYAVTICPNPKDFSSKLSDFGLSKQALPAALGGTFDAVTSRKIQQTALFETRSAMPLRVLQDVPIVALTRHGDPMASFFQQKKDNTSASRRVQVEPPISKKRKATLNPSKRQDAPKKKKTIASSQDQVSFNNDLLLDQPMLLEIEETESWNAETAGTATGVEASPEDARKEFIKKRNRLYSKRKYIRKKIEIEVLVKQGRAMQNENQKLKKEKERLEGLLQQAQECVKHGKRPTKTLNCSS
jgi:hypothetical protein